MINDVLAKLLLRNVKKLYFFHKIIYYPSWANTERLMAIKNLKYFHISDLLSAKTGRPLSNTGKLFMPNGEMREDYEGDAGLGSVRVMDHVCGLDQCSPDADELDFHELMYLSGHVRESLKKQFSWLYEIDDVPEKVLAAGKATIDLWILNDLVPKHGEWHKVEQVPIELPNKPGPVTVIFDEPGEPFSDDPSYD